MMRYRFTSPNGNSATSEMNEAAVLDYLARGYRLEVLGLSKITERVNAVREAAALWALDDMTADQLARAKELNRRYGIGLHEMNEVDRADRVGR